MPDTVATHAWTGYRHTPVAMDAVVIEDGFWADKQAVIRSNTLPHLRERIAASGAVDGFRLDWHEGTENCPNLAADTDVYKWIEAACYTLTTHPDSALRAQVDEYVVLIASAAQPDGYLNPYYTVVEPGRRFTNLRDAHELYSAGHLIEAAIAHHLATRQTTLLEVATRFADLLVREFGREPGQRRGYCGHPEIELALVRLYRHTGRREYLDLAAYFIDERGREPYYFDLEATQRSPIGFSSVMAENTGVEERRYNQTDKPVREQTEIHGHAVRAAYLYAAATEVAGLTHDQELARACHRLWHNMTSRRMYLTGGIGSARTNEGFTTDYDLPNLTAYSETCAAVASILWAHRMALTTGSAGYVDVLERILYNAALAGMSLDGQQFFYENPLASTGGAARKPWYRIACCAPNLTRLIASLGGYIYARDADALVLNLYINSRVRFTAGRANVWLTQAGGLPWHGTVRLTMRTNETATFPLRTRVPAWAHGAAVRINGQPVAVEAGADGYLTITRTWRNGDILELAFPVTPTLVHAHPAAADNRGRVAVTRGPLIYCFEQADQGNNIDPDLLQIPADVTLTEEYQDGPLGAVVIVTATGAEALDTDDGQDLYTSHPPRRAPAAGVAIPYYAWANRQPGAMRTWVRLAPPSLA